MRFLALLCVTLLVATVCVTMSLSAGAAFAIDDEAPVELTPTPDTEPVLDTSQGLETPSIPADAVMLPLGSNFTVLSGATSSISFTVPRGLQAEVFTAKVTGIRNSAVEVSQNGRVLALIDSNAQDITIPLDPAEAGEDGSVNLTFAFTGITGAWCAVDGSGQISSESINVGNASLALTGISEIPDSVANFFGLGAQAATVQIPAGSESDLGPAALNMVTAASSALGQGSAVVLQVDGVGPDMEEQLDEQEPQEPQVPLFAQRLVVLKAGAGEVITAIDRSEAGVARLTLTGGADELLAATRAFGDPGIALASMAETQGLSVRTDPTANFTTLTLKELGIDRVTLEGYGTQDAFIGVAQGSFGRSLDSIEIDLRGTVSSTESTVATVQLLWNDLLVDSFVVDPAQPEISRTIEVPAAGLRSGNGLVVRLQAVTANNECIDERLLPQVRLDIDTATSTVIGGSGASATARFADFPQSFSGTAQLAFGEAVTASQLSSAGSLVAALQRATPVPLVIEPVSADELINSSEPGILIGATSDQAQELRTPLRFAETRLISEGGTELTVAVDQPFAALQAVRQEGRSLLLLGAYLGTDESDPTGVLTAAVSNLEGTAWWQLDGSIRLATPGSDPVLIDMNEIVPQAEAKADYMPVAWWVLGGLLVLIVIGLVAAGARARNKRAARRTVEAEIAAGDAEAEVARGATSRSEGSTDSDADSGSDTAAAGTAESGAGYEAGDR